MAIDPRDWGDGAPADPTRFGHADQSWTDDGTSLEVTIARTKVDPRRLDTSGPRGLVLSTLDLGLDNVGIVAWLTNDSSCAIASYTDEEGDGMVVAAS